MTISSFDDFKSLFDQKMFGFKNAVHSFQWEDKECYAKWCAHTYYYVCHSTRLLAYGAARTSLVQSDIHRRFIEHLSEEKGHEKLVISDMKQLGVSMVDYPELPETALFYQNQYYWLNFHGALPFFGWVLALEGGAAQTCAAAYARVTTAHGASAGRFLKVHSEEDVEHLEKALNSIKGLSANDLNHIARNFEQSCELYFSVLKRISAESAISMKAAS